MVRLLLLLSHLHAVSLRGQKVPAHLLFRLAACLYE